MFWLVNNAGNKVTAHVSPDTEVTIALLGSLGTGHIVGSFVNVHRERLSLVQIPEEAPIAPVQRVLIMGLLVVVCAPVDEPKSQFVIS